MFLGCKHLRLDYDLAYTIVEYARTDEAAEHQYACEEGSNKGRGEHLVEEGEAEDKYCIHTRKLPDIAVLPG